ncbi:tobamovirus multiplication protein 2A-like isoform X1 [Canna indica]|uniref:Tobamovirus multiplication protein 2A-like isoform X1 n=1 Tax=Canna indica TaxID=4628 RepID=A0AAQ3JPH5_9LILI|nr:tobamovirus multiplication protein 2A-like isoform X1 [Canna indica]
MTCRGCFECLLKVLNFVLMVAGLAIVGYGVYLLVEWNKDASCCANGLVSSVNANPELISLGRPIFFVVSLSTSIVDNLQEAWFICLFIGIGIILVMISIFGYIGIKMRNQCCLSLFFHNDILLILVEVVAAAFMFFDHTWKEEIPVDKTGDFDMIYNFLKENWKIAKWVALLAVILEATIFFLALIVRAANQHEDYDSGDEYIFPRSDARQLLLNRQTAPAVEAPILGQRASRTDAWSQQMKDKYGIDIAEFTYNSLEPSRSHRATSTAAEERACCNIL